MATKTVKNAKTKDGTGTQKRAKAGKTSRAKPKIVTEKPQTSWHDIAAETQHERLHRL